jgi:hypothetical protein
MMISIWHWAIVLIVCVLVLLPLYFFSRAIAKAGFSRWWIGLAIVPFVNVIMLWVFACARWPAQPER